LPPEQSGSWRRSTLPHGWTRLSVPPSNRLEKLGGKLKNFHSIRINDQWRVIFQWTGNNAYAVSIVDYH